MKPLKASPNIHCCEDVSTTDGFRQCGGYRTHGPGRQYCKTHGRLQSKHAAKFEKSEEGYVAGDGI